MAFHGFVPFLFLGVQIQAGRIDAGVAGVTLKELNVNTGIGLVGDAGVAKPVGRSAAQLVGLMGIVRFQPSRCLSDQVLDDPVDHVIADTVGSFEVKHQRSGFVWRGEGW